MAEGLREGEGKEGGKMGRSQNGEVRDEEGKRERGREGERERERANAFIHERTLRFSSTKERSSLAQ